MKKAILFFSAVTIVISVLLCGCKGTDNVSSTATSADNSSWVPSGFENAIRVEGKAEKTDTSLDPTAAQMYYDAIHSIDKNNDRVAAKVNGKPIYDLQVQEGLARVNMGVYDNLAKELKTSELNDQQKQEYLDKNIMTYEQALKELVRVEVQKQTAVKKGFSFTEKEIYDETKKNVQSLKAEPSHYEAILNAYDMTEEEYIRYYMKNIETMALNSSLRNEFFKKLGDSVLTTESREELEQRYQKYVDKLVKKADIEYLQ